MLKQLGGGNLSLYSRAAGIPQFSSSTYILLFYSTFVPYICELVIGNLKATASHMYYFPLFTDVKTY